MNKTDKQNRPVESVADFKHRLARLARAQRGEGDYSVIGAAPSHPCVVRNAKPESEAAQ